LSDGITSGETNLVSKRCGFSRSRADADFAQGHTFNDPEREPFSSWRRSPPEIRALKATLKELPGTSHSESQI
jgi:hypothetical protein